MKCGVGLESDLCWDLGQTFQLGLLHWVCEVDFLMWSFKDMFEVHQFFVTEWLQILRVGSSFWVSVRLARGWMRENMCGSASWPCCSSFGPLLDWNGLAWRNSLFYHLNSFPALGCDLGCGAAGRASTPLWEGGWGVPSGTCRVWVSCVFKKKWYPLWACRWKQLEPSQDRFWFPVLSSVYSES